MSLRLFAGLRVRDFQAARSWYDQLLGEPTFFPDATEAVWNLAEDRFDVHRGARQRGRPLRGEHLRRRSRRSSAAIAARGLEPDESETYSNGVRKAVYRDPDGNELGFGGAPVDTRP